MGSGWFHCFDAVGLATGMAPENRMLICWWRWFEWSFVLEFPLSPLPLPSSPVAARSRMVWHLISAYSGCSGVLAVKTSSCVRMWSERGIVKVTFWLGWYLEVLRLWGYISLHSNSVAVNQQRQNLTQSLTRGFHTAAPTIWNSLPAIVRSCVTLSTIPSAFKITPLSVQLPHCLATHLSASGSLRPWRYINLLTYLLTYLLCTYQLSLTFWSQSVKGQDKRVVKCQNLFRFISYDSVVLRFCHRVTLVKLSGIQRYINVCWCIWILQIRPRYTMVLSSPPKHAMDRTLILKSPPQKKQKFLPVMWICTHGVEEVYSLLRQTQTAYSTIP